MSSADTNLESTTGVPGHKVFVGSLNKIGAPPFFIDTLVFGLFLAACVLAIFFHLRAGDFMYDDVSYLERARSLLQQGYDGFNGRLETTQPPGLPLIFAGICLLGGCGHGVLLGLMATFETLGFAVTYALFRREVLQVVAAAICVLLLFSPAYFSLATQWVATTFPFFFTITSALLVARKLEESRTTTRRVLWGTLLAVLGATSLMIATAGIALLGAIVVKIAVAFFRDRHLALTHLKNYLAVLLMGIIVQGVWMQRRPAPLEWPLPGYPRPYMQQLELKSGHYPELGYATWRDVAVRVKTNLQDETVLFVELFSSHWINSAWWSVVTAAPCFLILLGWGFALRRTKGDGLQEWFFAAYQFIHLLWPWKMEVRYFLPVAPLACLYLWRGTQALGLLAKLKPRLLGFIWIPVSVILAARSIVWLENDPLVVHVTESGLQQKVSFVAWLLTGIVAVWLVRKGPVWPAPVVSLAEGRNPRIGFLDLNPQRCLKLACGIVILGLTAVGFINELEIGRENFDLHSAVNRVTPDVKAAMWIRTHSATDAVIMARHVPITYYYADRKVVWFPPSSNSQLLMEGIQRNNIDYVIAVKRGSSYYRPPEDDCMAALLATFPSALRLIEQTPDFRILQVIKNERPESHLAANTNR